MIAFKTVATSEIYFDCTEDWEIQLEQLKTSFENFHLLKFKRKRKNTILFHVFKFTHFVLVKKDQS